jgi:hypothetical protein
MFGIKSKFIQVEVVSGKHILVNIEQIAFTVNKSKERDKGDPFVDSDVIRMQMSSGDSIDVTLNEFVIHVLPHLTKVPRK